MQQGQSVSLSGGGTIPCNPLLRGEKGSTMVVSGESFLVTRPTHDVTKVVYLFAVPESKIVEFISSLQKMEWFSGLEIKIGPVLHFGLGDRPLDAEKRFKNVFLYGSSPAWQDFLKTAIAQGELSEWNQFRKKSE